MKLKEADSVLGMSEPFFFSANVAKDKRRMIFHCVVFTSFEVPAGGSECEYTICFDDCDPRMPEFIKFVWKNFLSERKHELEKLLAEAQKITVEERKELDKLEKQYVEKLDKLAKLKQNESHTPAQ